MRFCSYLLYVEKYISNETIVEADWCRRQLLELNVVGNIWLKEQMILGANVGETKYCTVDVFGISSLVTHSAQRCTHCMALTVSNC